MAAGRANPILDPGTARESGISVESFITLIQPGRVRESIRDRLPVHRSTPVPPFSKVGQIGNLIFKDRANLGRVGILNGTDRRIRDK